MSIDVESLNPAGGVPPVVTWKNRKAFEVTYKKGVIHSIEGGYRPTFAPRDIFPCEACKCKFDVWLADNFPLEKTQTRNVGGKLGGFRIGSGNASGNRYTPNAATYRLVFNAGGYVNPYLYPETKKEYTGNKIPWSLLDQKQGVQDVSAVYSGVHVWHPTKIDDENKDGMNGMFLKKGQWNRVSMYCKLNTPGKYDGILELKVNGIKRKLSDVRYRNDKALIGGFQLETFFGGSDMSYAPPEDTRAYFAGYKFVKK
jgi:hypothetical protein